GVCHGVYTARLCTVFKRPFFLTPGAPPGAPRSGKGCPTPADDCDPSPPALLWPARGARTTGASRRPTRLSRGRRPAQFTILFVGYAPAPAMLIRGAHRTTLPQMATADGTAHPCTAARNQSRAPAPAMGTPGVHRSRFLLAFGAAALLALAACGASSGPDQQTSHINARDLFTEGYDKISYYYIEPTNPERLGLAGLNKLASLDSSIGIERQGVTIVLTQNGVPIGRYDAPEAGDASGWGGVTASALEAARRASPKIASTSEGQLDKIVFDGAVGTLDRFSRYATPDAAREQRAERNGFDGIGVTL